MIPKLKILAKDLHGRLLNALHLPVRARGIDGYHQTIHEFNHRVEGMPSPRILELGSRNVTGVTHRQRYANASEYAGFDIHAGEGVDVVGDAHQLSRYFPANHFDVVIAFSVFEHLLFPWKVVLEINRVMKPGGLMLITTHPVWPAHELPWDFWRFSKGSCTSLLNASTGFTLLRCEEGLPATAYSLAPDAPTRGLFRYPLYQGIAAVAAKATDYSTDLLKWEIDLSAVTSTSYPKGKKDQIDSAAI